MHVNLYDVDHVNRCPLKTGHRPETAVGATLAFASCVWVLLNEDSTTLRFPNERHFYSTGFGLHLITDFIENFRKYFAFRRRNGRG